MVKRAVRGSEKPIGGSRGQAGGFRRHRSICLVKRAVRGSERIIGGSRDQLEGLEASQSIWGASQGSGCSSWGRGGGETKKGRNGDCGTIGHQPLWGCCSITTINKFKNCYEVLGTADQITLERLF